MLTLTQLSVGAFVVNFVLERLLGGAPGGRLAQAVFSIALGLLALAASLLHLGRPQGAWKAFLGFRTSWLSREIIAFGAFAKLGLGYALALLAPGISVLSRRLHDVGLSGWLVAGVFGVYVVGAIMTAAAMPVGGVIILLSALCVLVVALIPSRPGANQYGPNPKGV